MQTASEQAAQYTTTPTQGMIRRHIPMGTKAQRMSLKARTARVVIMSGTYRPTAVLASPEACFARGDALTTVYGRDGYGVAMAYASAHAQIEALPEDQAHNFEATRALVRHMIFDGWIIPRLNLARLAPIGAMICAMVAIG